MKVLCAYLLAVLGGKDQPTKDDLKAILNSVGARHEENDLDEVMSRLKGQDVEKLTEMGKSLFVATGGGGAGGQAASAAPSEHHEDKKKEDKKEDKKKEEKKEEEKKEEPVEDDDEPMGFSLFDE